MAVLQAPQVDTAYEFYAELVSAGDPTIFQANPTLEAGDVKVSFNGAALVNLTTLPVVTPAGGTLVKVNLSVAEMPAGNVVVQFKDQTDPPEWLEVSYMIQPDASISSRASQESVSSGEITVISPVLSALDVVIRHGDDYLDADGRALSWQSSSWPDLTGAAIVLHARNRRTGTVTNFDGTSTPGTPQTVKVEMTDAETEALGTGYFDMDIQATLASGSVVTLVSSTLKVVADVR